VNSGWGGWVWAPEVRSATANADFTRRAQLMLFSALASMDGWNTGFVPWNSSAVDAESEAMFANMAQERAKLSPFLYSAYQRQGVDGVPVARAMMVDFDNDTASYSIEDQYLLGDGLMVAPVGATESQNSTQRTVHFPPGYQWIDYWNPTTGVTHQGGTNTVVAAPLTTLPLFQRKGSVVPMLDLDDETVLVLKTHDNGQPHRGFVYDDDGISTNAELYNEYFRLATETSYGGSSVTLTARVEHAHWEPTWRHVRWEVAGSRVEQWESITCGGETLPRVAMEMMGEIGGGWAVTEAKATLLLPVTAQVGWEITCIAK
jgi:alpha-D-xyloside xylohydrolase